MRRLWAGALLLATAVLLAASPYVVMLSSAYGGAMPAAAATSVRVAAAVATSTPQGDRAPSPPGARATRTLRICARGAAQTGCDYTSLQDALAAAMPGDQVVLAPG